MRENAWMMIAQWNLSKDSQNGGRYNESEVTFIMFVDEKIEELPARWS
jgi:hypothetical protein